MQVHFDATSFVIDASEMLELPQVKIAIKLAVDASQKVEVEGGSHSDFVVVGRFECNSERFFSGARKEFASTCVSIEERVDLLLK